MYERNQDYAPLKKRDCLLHDIRHCAENISILVWGGGGDVDYGKTAGGPGCRSQLYGQDPGAKKSNMIK